MAPTASNIEWSGVTEPTVPSLAIGEHLRLRLVRGRRTTSTPVHGGWCTPYCLHFLDVVEGRFRFEHAACGPVELGPGDGFLVATGQRHFIRVAQESTGVIRYGHLQATLFGTIDCCALFDLPVLLDRHQASSIGDGIEALDKETYDTFDITTAIRRQRLRLAILDQILGLGSLTTAGRSILGGAQGLAEVLQYIATHLEEPLDRIGLARVACLSPSRFNAVFARVFSCSPMRYLRHLRLERACELLVTTDASIAAIADRLCFHDAFHFSKAFKNYVGLSPSVYRRQHRPLEW